MKISEKIIRIRNERKLTQEEFAEVLGVSRQTVSNWENNKCYPDLETLILISEKFNISFDNIIKEDKEMVKNLDKKIHSYRSKIIMIISIFIILILMILSFIGYKYYLLDYYDYEYYDSSLKTYANNITSLKIERNIELANTHFYNLNIYIPENLERDNTFDFDYNLDKEDAIVLFKYDNPFYEMKSNKEFYKNIDYEKIFEKYNIENPVTLIKDFENSYDDNRNILWSKDALKLNFLAKQFVTVKMNFSGGKGYKIYYWNTYNDGYMLEQKNYYSINVYDGKDTYYIGINKNIVNFTETLKVISSIYFG